MGVNLRRGDALMAEQGLDVHPFSASVEQVRGVSRAQFVRGNLLVDAGLLEHPPQVSASRCEDIGFWSGARPTSSNRGSCRPAPLVELPVGGVGHGARVLKTVLEKCFKRWF